MGYEVQELEVYKLSLTCLNQIYELSDNTLPVSEKYNLGSQLQRAAISITLNLAEGSTGLSDAEQRRFILIASRSYLETVACFDIKCTCSQEHNEA